METEARPRTKRYVMVVLYVFLIIIATGVVFGIQEEWNKVLICGISGVIFLLLSITFHYLRSDSISRDPSEQNVQYVEDGQDTRTGEFNATAESGSTSRQPVDQEELGLAEIGVSDLVARHLQRISQPEGQRRLGFDSPPEYSTLRTARGTAGNDIPVWSATEPVVDVVPDAENSSPKVFQPSTDGLPSYEAAVATRNTSNGPA